MNPKIALADLKLYRIYVEEIQECERQLERNAAKKEKLYQARTCSWSDEPKVRPTKGTDSFLIGLIDEERVIRDKMKDFRAKLNELDIFIANLDEEARIFITDKYVHGLTWSELKEKHHYSRQRMDKVIRLALSKV